MTFLSLQFEIHQLGMWPGVPRSVSGSQHGRLQAILGDEKRGHLRGSPASTQLVFPFYTATSGEVCTMRGRPMNADSPLWYQR